MTKKKDDEKLKVPIKQHTRAFADPLKYSIVSDGDLEFDKESAYAFLELPPFHGERSVLESHVQFLFDEWVCGRFLWQNVILASAKFGTSEYRINGQHTAWMRVNIPERVEPLKVSVRRMVYEVHTSDQLRALYSAFDRGKMRTNLHISKVMLMDSRAGREIPLSLLGRLVAGFRVYFAPDWAKTRNVNELIGMIEKNYEELFNLVGRFLQIHVNEVDFAKRAAIIGAMFATFEKNVKVSDEFWGAVLNGIGLNSQNDARYRLRQFCLTHGHNIMTKGVDFITQEALYCTCVLAWNHYRSGEEVLSLKTIYDRPKVKS